MTNAPKSITGTLQVYNTLTKRKEPFTTVRPGKVGIYLCGPTVYKEAHIGHMVGPVIFVVLIWAHWRAWRHSDGLSTEEKFLIAYIIPPFIIIRASAFISSANENLVAVDYTVVQLCVTSTLI